MRTEKKTVNLSSKVSFRLDNKRMNQLERYASIEGFSVSQVIRHVVCRFLEDQRKVVDVPSFNFGGFR